MGKEKQIGKGKPTEDGVMHIVEHLQELRQRIIYCLVAIVVGAGVAFAFYHWIVSLFTEPFTAVALESSLEARLFITNVTEGFLVRVKISVIAGIILTLPIILYNVLRFVFPGLERHERGVTLVALLAGLLLAVGGFYYSYSQIVPVSLRFLTAKGFVPDQVGVLLNYATNISFVLQLLLITVILFQLPIVLLALLKLEVVSRRAAVRASRYVIVGILGLSAILSPPDVVSQIALAVPLVALYFLAILIAAILRYGEGRTDDKPE